MRKFFLLFYDRTSTKMLSLVTATGGSTTSSKKWAILMIRAINFKAVKYAYSSKPGREAHVPS